MPSSHLLDLGSSPFKTVGKPQNVHAQQAAQTRKASAAGSINIFLIAWVLHSIVLRALAFCCHGCHKWLLGGVWVQAMRKAVSILYNASGDASCYNASQLTGPAGPGATWLFQW